MKTGSSEQDDVRAGRDQAQCNALGFFIQNFIAFGVFFPLKTRPNCTTLVLGVWKDQGIPSVPRETPGKRPGGVIEHKDATEALRGIFLFVSPFFFFFLNCKTKLEALRASPELWSPGDALSTGIKLCFPSLCSHRELREWGDGPQC